MEGIPGLYRVSNIDLRAYMSSHVRRSPHLRKPCPAAIDVEVDCFNEIMCFCPYQGSLKVTWSFPVTGLPYEVQTVRQVTEGVRWELHAIN